jgi:hypothetical protein
MGRKGIWEKEASSGNSEESSNPIRLNGCFLEILISFTKTRIRTMGG